MYQTISSANGVVVVEGVYATEAEAEQHAARLRRAGCYASTRPAK